MNEEKKGRWWYKRLSDAPGVKDFVMTKPDGRMGAIITGRYAECDANTIAHELNTRDERIEKLEQQLAEAQKNGERWRAFQRFFKMDHVFYHVLHEQDRDKLHELQLEGQGERLTGLDRLMDWIIEHGKTPTAAYYDEQEAE